MRPRTAPDDWQSSPLPPGSARRGGASPARRAACAFAKLLADMLSNEEIASRSGFLQRADARVKVVAVLALVVAATIAHGIAALAVLYGLSIVLALGSRVPFARLARVWLVVPLFSAAIALPALLSAVTPGTPAFVLRCASPEIVVTYAGLAVAGRFVLRAAACVSLVTLLTATTRPDELFAGLRSLGVPRVFVMLLSMMERYLWVLARVAEEIHMAKASRSIARGSLHDEHAWVAAGMGSLYRRTRALGNEVYLAMISRGYTGEVVADGRRSRS